jgi:hypothetical protein
MPRKYYIAVFMLLSVLFIPVLLNMGLAMLIAPTCYLIFSLFTTTENFFGMLFVLIHIFVYCSAFYVAALITFWLSGGASWPRVVRITLQTMFLLAVFSCSFARVIEGSSFREGTGTYNFWGAVHRYFEKRHAT